MRNIIQYNWNLLAMIFLLLGSQKHGSMNTNMTSMTYLTTTAYIDLERGEEVGGCHCVWKMA